jgi:hypothetical protein
MNLRARSVSLPPRANLVPPFTPSPPQLHPSLPSTPVHTISHSLSLPSTPVISHVHATHISPRNNSPRDRSSSPIRIPKIMKEGTVRVKGIHNELHQSYGWAAVRDMGASSVLQIWRESTGVQIHTHPDIVLDIDTLHPAVVSVEIDKVDPRCITIAHKEGDTTNTHMQHLPVTLVFETEEVAAEWATLLNDLRL